jgi:amino acid adenylation domain-containing protein
MEKFTLDRTNEPSDADLNKGVTAFGDVTAKAQPCGPENVLALIAAAFAAMPNQPAAEFYGAKMSRAQLVERSDRLAAWLIRKGAGRGSLVAIYMDRSLEMLVAMLGIMKAGAAYVPLDPAFPPARIAQIVEETNVPVMITLSRHLDALPASEAMAIALDDESIGLKSEPAVALPRIQSDERAYVIFTSGSTGRPKGVEVCHGSVVNLLTDAAQRLGMKPEDRLLAVTTLSFDISVLEMLLPLVSGGTVVIAHRDDVADGAQLKELLQATRATVLQATPVTWRMLLEQGFQVSPGFKMLCGGEAWTAAMGDQLLEHGGRLWNMYGPTETTVWSSITEVERGAGRMTIGPPIANTRFYVLDARLQLVPPGVPGELFIAGDGVARGYFERPELTAEKFLTDPFVPGERMYRTGDEVQQLADGRIEFLGRLDHQIKLRGFRIELGDVETAMRALPGIRDAVAVLRPDASGEAMLVGYYTGSENLTAAEMKRALGSHLPIYMVPTVMKSLPSLPLTPNGKIDRKALPDPRSEWIETASVSIRRSGIERNEARESASGVKAVPSAVVQRSTVSETERHILRIWQQILRVGDLDVESNFFDLGGHSLLLARMQVVMESEFGVNLTAAEVFRHPTVGAMAAWLEQAQSESKLAKDGDLYRAPSHNPDIVPIQPLGEGRPIFVISQSMIFRRFAEELGVDQPVYAVQIVDQDTAAMVSASFEKLVDYYVRQIRDVQPRGPYRVAGWCVSGWIAYGIARQLEREGEEIEMAMIIDAWAPEYWSRQPSIRRRLMVMIYHMQRFRWMVRRLTQRREQRSSSDIRQSFQTFAAAVKTLIARFQHARRPVDPRQREEDRRSEQLEATARLASKSGPLQGNALFFRSEEEPSGPLLAADMGWSELVGRPVHVEMTLGNHREIFNLPGARLMANCARELLGLPIDPSRAVDTHVEIEYEEGFAKSASIR